jgi:hypothetical protein
MDLAVSAVILILLLLPALLFRTFLIQADSLENPLDTSIKTELGIIFLIALFQHLFGYLIIKYTGIYDFQFDQLYFILIGEADKINASILNYSFVLFFYYTLIQIIIGISLSLLAKWVILRYYLDIRFSFLPITNEWDQLLSGRIYEYDRIKRINTLIRDLKEFQRGIILEINNDEKLSKKNRNKDTIEINNQINQELISLNESRKIPDYNYVEIDALVNTAGGDMIYKGRVYKYYLSKGNSLDKIVLKDAFRRRFIDIKTLKNSAIEFYEFESKLFVIKYDEIKNLNVRFTFIEEDIDEDSDIEQDDLDEDFLIEVEKERENKKKKKKNKR